MAEARNLEDLSRKVDQLQQEQQRLQQEQDKLRNSGKDGQDNKGANDGQPQNDKNDNKREEKNDGDKQEKKPEQKQPEAPKEPLTRRARGYVAQHPGRVLLGLIALVVLVVGGIFLWMYFSSYESTDDAEVDGHINMISPRVAGTVVGVYIEDDQFVKAGQTLVDLDPRDFKVALQQASGAYDQAVAQLRAENPSVPIVQTSNQTTISTGNADVQVAERAVGAAQQEYEAKQADLRSAEAQDAKAQRDVIRFQPLADKEEISRQQFDGVVATAKSQAAGVDAAKAAVQVALRTLDERRAQLEQAKTRLIEAQRNAPRQTAVRQATVATRQAGIISAKAVLEQARLNLSYTKIAAPVEGVVVNKTVEVGQDLQRDEEMLAISQIQDLWITANFKETQLRRMRPGESVDVKVDAFGATYHGYIESMPGSTGARTSLLPPENATGNYVKVVQRLPVRIRLKQGEDSQHRLRIGMSVEPKVWLNSNR
ncbi:MAG: efflux RND transporter periplasmic adaptor subunit [Bryobacterales bacterium]|nr:efflux RND transporter periplasmic adaptor subunit [Bryobacterales bacterium]